MKPPIYDADLRKFFDTLAPVRDQWIQANSYYYQELTGLHQRLIPINKKVLEIGCGTGNLLHMVKPKLGVGIDFSHEMVKIAARKYPRFTFKVMDAQNLEFSESFDYIILSNLVGYVEDIWQVFRELQKVCYPRTRIVITNYNYFWQPVLNLAEKLHLKMPDRIQNWLPQEFIEHFLYLNGFTVLKKGKTLICPVDLGLVSSWMNRLAGNLPLIGNLGLVEYIVCQPKFLQESKPQEIGVSVVVPTHEEAGNVEAIVELMPVIGKFTEVIFVDLPGKDGTARKIKLVRKTYFGPLKIIYLKQTQKTGKIGALRLGVSHARGDIILIYDADLTVPPEDLRKFYLALIERKAELINGTRLVYPTEKGAMRLVNHIGNWIFARLFTWSLGQHFTDTLCGSKGFWKADFTEFENTELQFDRLDNYGDFYLLLGAYRRNMQIAEVPVRYKTRRYGDTKMQRLHNGWRFLKMWLYFYWNYKLLQRKEF